MNSSINQHSIILEDEEKQLQKLIKEFNEEKSEIEHRQKLREKQELENEISKTMESVQLSKDTIG
jgi:hypothetical protein